MSCFATKFKLHQDIEPRRRFFYFLKAIPSFLSPIPKPIHEQISSHHSSCVLLLDCWYAHTTLGAKKDQICQR